MGPLSRSLTLITALVVVGAIARADSITIDTATAGTVYDGILDGIPPFPPPGEAPDGDGDSQNTSLAVAKASFVEERAIVEFPLAPLAALAATDIASATLTFNIDDVIGTFWPGGNFDNTAADSIIVFTYAGNGTVDLADFANVAGAPAGVVDTTALGVITDATLAVSGPLQLQVDLTSRLQGLIAGGATHMGLVFVTDDVNSATSIDDLGLGSAGPPGIGGAALPFLTVVTVPAQPPTWDKARLNCQKALAKRGTALSNTAEKGLIKCFDAVLAATAKAKSVTDVAAKCTADLAPGDPDSKVGKAIGKLQTVVADKCFGLLPSDLGSPCDPSAATFGQVATCIVTQHLARTTALVADAYGPACALITAVGLETAYPAACD